MNIKSAAISFAVATAVIISSCGSGPDNTADENQASEITFREQQEDKRVDVMVDGELFTSYRWPDSVYKPILYPILTAAGTPVTRGFPLQPREGERSDHMHQVGNWFNYGNVNGYDFWGNGSEGVRNVDGGQIKHSGVQNLSGGKGEGSFTTTASWLDPAGKELLSEKTEFHFIANGTTRFIDRVVTLTATGQPVTFKDTKEGSFGIRVARQLELPSKEDVTLTDAKGNPTTVAKLSNEGVTGNYKSSEGVTGDSVWGKRAKWMSLYGNIGDEKVSVIICDHPKNLSYPTYWHARGYGLFAANPFGAKDFTSGKEELNFSLAAGESLQMRYRIVVSSGQHLTDEEINASAQEFSNKYQ